MAEKQLDAKYLKGLKCKSSEGKQVVEDGRKVTKYTPVERDLRSEDVLDWKDCGDKVVLVAADGQKHTVSKREK